MKIDPSKCLEVFFLRQKNFMVFFLREGLWKGERVDTSVRGTMFVRNGAVTPGPSPLGLLKDDRNQRGNCVTIQWRRARRRASPYHHPG